MSHFYCYDECRYGEFLSLFFESFFPQRISSTSDRLPGGLQSVNGEAKIQSKAAFAFMMVFPFTSCLISILLPKNGKESTVNRALGSSTYPS